MNVSKLLDSLNGKEYEQINDTIILDVLINNIKNMIADEDVKAILLKALDESEVLLNQKTKADETESSHSITEEA